MANAGHDKVGWSVDLPYFAIQAATGENAEKIGLPLSPYEKL